ncbi:CCAAT/enhancer-binding protein beta-like [Melitaea cinxia]|uniref:CCAAT/enhancer-binding protein beta-like n=1 Tax=Melitaea cinxia TaxID=113334 RepID=UPI001E26F58C|nr:CCAAT/enhancer-binding protein beta-like [Melitaea cinxia]
MSIWRPFENNAPSDISVNQHQDSAPSALENLTLRRVNAVPSAAPTQPAVVLASMAIRVSPSNSPDSPSAGSHPHFMADVDALQNDSNYQIFERNALRAMSQRNGGPLLRHNPRMRRAVQTENNADDSYRRQRERNNIAAKQSRDKRKLREIRLGHAAEVADTPALRQQQLTLLWDLSNLM